MKKPFQILYHISCIQLRTATHVLERTRGAGAPEVLRRETAEEEFRLRRNQPLNMAPSAPKYRYYQAENFAKLFQKNDFLGSRQTLREPLSASYFRDPFWDPSANVPTLGNEAGCTAGSICAFGAHTHQTDIRQTRTSYLGTGVAD